MYSDVVNDISFETGAYEEKADTVLPETIQIDSSCNFIDTITSSCLELICSHSVNTISLVLIFHSYFYAVLINAYQIVVDQIIDNYSYIWTEEKTYQNWMQINYDAEANFLINKMSSSVIISTEADFFTLIIILFTNMSESSNCQFNILNLLDNKFNNTTGIFFQSSCNVLNDSFDSLTTSLMSLVSFTSTVTLTLLISAF